MQIGEVVQDRKMTTESGEHSLYSLMGKHGIVLYFYPKDDTPGCTVEACGFRDTLTDISALGWGVAGVSTDSVKSHEAFIQKYQLNFPLIADHEHAFVEYCGLWQEKSMFGKKYWGVNRATFLLNTHGEVLHIWNPVDVKKHTQEVLEKIRSL